MDPQATWDQLLSAHRDGDWDDIEELATALLGWLDRGGFPPQIVTSQHLEPDLAAEWNLALARAGCAYVLDLVEARWNVRPQHDA